MILEIAPVALGVLAAYLGRAIADKLLARQITRGHAAGLRCYCTIGGLRLRVRPVRSEES